VLKIAIHDRHIRRRRGKHPFDTSGRQTAPTNPLQAPYAGLERATTSTSSDVPSCGSSSTKIASTQHPATSTSKRHKPLDIVAFVERRDNDHQNRGSNRRPYFALAR
jgi:hypothetical protein